ncbi:MAG TPA: hypothetical protein VGX52_09515 [Burkholderiales bacterium]|nr:hypothetical protein [Burkholderiales bacterium]
MDAWLNDPMVQASLAPFLAGFVVTLLLFKLRLGGLAAVAGFCTTAWLIGELQFTPLTAKRKLMQLALAAPALGLLVDLAFRPGRTTAYVLGVAFGAASIWVFSSVLVQKAPVQAFILGGGIVLFVAWTVAFTASLHASSVRGGAAGLGLGLGAGFAALMAASASFAQLGMALGAASGGFLLVQMLFGRRIDAGLVFCLAAGVQGALVAAAALLLGNLGWTALAILAAVPLAARLPLPTRWPVWGQAILASLYTLACGGAAVASVYLPNRRWPSWLQ